MKDHIEADIRLDNLERLLRALAEAIEHDGTAGPTTRRAIAEIREKLGNARRD